MIGMERNPRECNLRWNKRVKSESKDRWMDGWKERLVVARGSSIKENEESRRGEGEATRKAERGAARERERDAR